MGRSLLFNQPVEQTIVKHTDNEPELPLDFQELESLTNQDLLKENYCREEINRECKYFEEEISIALEAFDGVLTTVDNLTALKTEEPEMDKITFALESYSKAVDKLDHITNGHISCTGIGLESIVNSPLLTIEAAVENVGDMIQKALQSIMSFLKWLYDKLVGWVKYLVASFSTLKRSCKNLKNNMEEFLKYNPSHTILRGDTLRQFASWFNGSYRGIVVLQDKILVQSPLQGMDKLGSNIQSTIFKEQNLVYPGPYEVSFQSLNEFYISFRDYYNKIDINSDRMLTNMTSDLATYLLNRHGLQEHDTVDTVVRLIACDLRSIYYFICAVGEHGNKVIVDRVTYRQMGKSYKKFLDPIPIEDMNVIFNGNPSRWVLETCDMIIRNADKALGELNKVAGRVKTARDDVKKVYNRYAMGNNNTALAKVAARYGRYIQKLVAKYQQGSVNANVQVFRDLKIIANRIYSHLVQSR